MSFQVVVVREVRVGGGPLSVCQKVPGVVDHYEPSLSPSIAYGIVGVNAFRVCDDPVRYRVAGEMAVVVVA